GGGGGGGWGGGAARGRICRRRDHRVGGRAQRCARAGDGGPDWRTACRGTGWTAPCPPARARAANRRRYRKIRALRRRFLGLPRLPHACCGGVRNVCCERSAPSGTVFKLSAAPLPPPKPAIACTS